MKAAGTLLTQIFLFCSIVGHAQELKRHRITDIHTEHRIEKDVLAAVEWDITVDVKAELDVAFDGCSRKLKNQIIKSIAGEVNQAGTIKNLELSISTNCYIGEVKINATPSVCYYREGAQPVCKVTEANAQ